MQCGKGTDPELGERTTQKNKNVRACPFMPTLAALKSNLAKHTIAAQL